KRHEKIESINKQRCVTYKNVHKRHDTDKTEHNKRRQLHYDTAQ
ncbi:33277_t:CDS:1, partial [Gigaspora margarita]